MALFGVGLRLPFCRSFLKLSRRTTRLRGVHCAVVGGLQQQHKQSQTEEPLRYSETEIANWSSDKSFVIESGAPAYQSPCVLYSLLVFMLYFFVLRDENDIDEFLGDNVFLFIDPYKDKLGLENKIKLLESAGKDCSKEKEQLAKVLAVIHAKAGAGALETSLERIRKQKEEEDAVKAAAQAKRAASSSS